MNQEMLFADVPGMSAEELRRVLLEWNDTRVNYARKVCLHQLFERQVEKSPDAVAVTYEGKKLTYRELNEHANQLAHHLQKFGVGKESLVGVFMERSLEMVVALYGILKAGGAYVPVDPEYPKDRVAFMIEDAGVPVLLTQEHLVEELPSDKSAIVCLDKDWGTVAKESRANPNSDVTEDNLAYVIYTSGSTGRPKGAMNCHKGICNRLFWMQDAYQLSSADNILQKTPFSFDVSVWEFFWPLLFGAKIVVAKPGGHKDSNYLINMINREGITTIHFVPSMLQIFLEHKDVSTCRSLRRVICSGEALPVELQERFFSRLNAELHNLYGPTEAAVDVTYWACEKGSDLGFVPIGRPVANTQIYILDSELRPVPNGAVGELHIGGIQVGRGYLNRPELTQKNFIPDPFRDDPEARLYKSGDLACFLSDGVVKYLGRIDDQVKIGGIRIELGEIEAILEKYPLVKQAVVLARDDDPGEKRLVAYLVTESGQAIATYELRSYLQEKLPEVMVPSAFVLIGSMPLSPNGKVDRRKLPAPENKRPELGQPYVAPRNELEEHLAAIWREILKLNEVGVCDRFFELGGTSLKAARFINRLQTELNENIYIVSIFEAPTIAEYAAFLQRDYTDALQKRLGIKVARTPGESSKKSTVGEVNRIKSEDVARMIECIPPLSQWQEKEEGAKNPPAIFILSPPRSGTTLLRVMLAGHPDLFAAAELQLLGFNTLKERREAFSGKYSLWLEGTIRAVMEIKKCDAGKAMQIIEEYEQRNYTTKQLYGVFQDWLGNKILVDKSPSYVFDPGTLEKAERDFDRALYIHLVRHPYAMVRSFVQYHIDHVLFLKNHPFSPQQLGELIWLISQKNTLRFLEKVPSERYFVMRFEDLVTRPEKMMEEMCGSLGLKYHPNLADPYKDIDKKMTDGIYKDSKPMGDTKLLERKSIDPTIAEIWKKVEEDNFLSDMTWEMAARLGYPRPAKIMEDDAVRGRKKSTALRRKGLDGTRQRRQQIRKSIQGETTR